MYSAHVLKRYIRCGRFEVHEGVLFVFMENKDQSKFFVKSVSARHK